MMSGSRTAIESTLIFSAPALSTSNMSSTERMPPTDGERDEHVPGDAAHGLEVDLASLGARRDVVEDDLVDLVGVELLRELLGGRDVDVVLELLRLGDPAVDHVEARDEPLGQHGEPCSVGSHSANARNKASPSGPLFSAWNWVATTFFRATTEQNSRP